MLEDYNDHCSFVVNYKKYSKIVNLIESSGDGFIRIWNFNSAELLKKIKEFLGSVFGVIILFLLDAKIK